MVREMYELLFYRNDRGDAPVEKYILEQPEKDRAKILVRLELLAEKGPTLKRPFADVLRGRLRELRVPRGRNQHRILYFFVLRTKVILLHAFRKKTGKVPKREMEVAEVRMEEINRRIAAGETLP